MDKIAMGGGCHWCTEAVFQELNGVQKVEQGFVASNGKISSFSEAVIVHFDSDVISLSDLIEIHLHTHRSTSNHSMRDKYRSAIYTFNFEQHRKAEKVVKRLQSKFHLPLVTKVLPFARFKPSADQFKNYYSKNPEKPFCKRYIDPKLELLQERFSKKLVGKKSISSEN
ncbi:peptide-methionine (S)-S-oxide reductase [Flavobacteriaceae bacterium MAR_2009_75]|nr:peptide-methionine (S)-S-oxide reductase [Flavobacteriaceae bacterium MAR_2009_75]